MEEAREKPAEPHLKQVCAGKLDRRALMQHAVAGAFLAGALPGGAFLSHAFAAEFYAGC